MLEVLAALVVTAAFVAVVLPFAGRLVQRWWTGEATIEAADAWMQAIARLSDDLEQAVPVSVSDGAARVLCFRAGPKGVRFVRPSLGVAAATDLEVVSLTIESKASGDMLVRRARPFSTDCLGEGQGAASTILEGPFRLRFASVAEGGHRQDNWTEGKGMPIRVELSAVAMGHGQVPPTAIVLPIAARANLADPISPGGAPSQ